MIRELSISLFALLLASCSSNKTNSSNKAINETSENKVAAARDSIPDCLIARIDSMAGDSSQGVPQSITRYQYKGQTVYYIKAPCCDKFNIVFDTACNVLGYPDGGFTGRGDGKMPGFKKEATNAKVVWNQKMEK